MEPGREDREYVKTPVAPSGHATEASMEPGREDREYPAGIGGMLTNDPASMEPGREDREYVEGLLSAASVTRCLSGTRP